MKDKLPIQSESQFLVYQTEDGKLKIDVRFQGETVWLSLNQLAELFQRDKSVISRHIKNVFDEGELHPEGTVAKSATVQIEGGKQVTRDIEFFNLDMIISVGYRVKSAVAIPAPILANIHQTSLISSLSTNAIAAEPTTRATGAASWIISSPPYSSA
jgi:hypothetical protein